MISFKNFKNNKGLTGVDIVTSITIVIVTMGVITAIYMNTVNKTKENIRYSNATRIATQIIENIQANPYEDLIYRCKNNLSVVDSNTAESNRKIFDVNVPNGYTAEVISEKNSTDKWDLVREVTVNVSYKILNKQKTITLSTVKERELLEQTNKPFLHDLNYYYNYNIEECYPIKKVNDKYLVTTIDDVEWYNYDIGNYALVFHTTNTLNIGDEVTPDTTDIYIWVPRFGIKTSDTDLTKDNLGYAYGTSKYKIEYSLIGDDLYSYTLNYTSENIPDSKPVSLNSYATNTFTDNDALTGCWFQNGMTVATATNEYQTTAVNSFNSLNLVNECKNN